MDDWIERLVSIGATRYMRHMRYTTHPLGVGGGGCMRYTTHRTHSGLEVAVHQPYNLIRVHEAFEPLERPIDVYSLSAHALGVLPSLRCAVGHWKVSQIWERSFESKPPLRRPVVVPAGAEAEILIWVLVG